MFLSEAVLRAVLGVLLVCVSEWCVVTGSFSQSLDSDFTFTLPAGRKECFFQTMKKDASLEVEYQVFFSLFKCDLSGTVCDRWGRG